MIKSILFLAACAELFSASALEVDFHPGAWATNDWILVKSPRWNYCHDFVQKEDGIENACPDLPGSILFAEHASDVYSAMVHRERFSLGASISSTMRFDNRMAPLIVLAGKLDATADGRPQFGEHWEMVLYDEGLNVWYHYLKDGKPVWYRAAFLNTTFAPNTPYRLEVKVVRTRKGQKEMTISCGCHTLGFVHDALPETFYAGIIGCEGRNRFYNFSVHEGK